MEDVKKECLTNCKEPNKRFKKFFDYEERFYKLLALTTDDNIIVGIIVQSDIKNEREIWNYIESSLHGSLGNILKKQEEESGRIIINKECLQEIDNLIAYLENEIFSKITTLTVNDIKNSQKSKKTKNSFKEKDCSNYTMSEILIKTSSAHNEVNEVGQEYILESTNNFDDFWYQKNCFFFFFGIFLLILIFSVIFVAKYLMI
jgi:hypothetical protein